jgi:glycosyltransferase involved in cell wall biosynthesis
VIAVVIPAFNARAFVADAIACVRAQTMRVSEIVVVDDGSRDGTGSVAARAGARVVRQRNRGPAAARNLGIRATTGRWIAFLDADDVWDADKLERQSHLANTFRDVAVISCDRRTVRNGRVIERSYFANLPGYPTLARHAADAGHSYFGRVTETFLARGPVLLPSTLLVRRAVFESVGLCSSRRRDDLYLHHRRSGLSH